MLPTHRNRGGYEGERIDIDAVLAACRESAARRRGIVYWIDPLASILAIHLPARAPGAPRIYLSAGIHGDEPAGPMALAEALLHNALSPNWDWTVFPCLNPEAFKTNQRETLDGIDLNRDYLSYQSPITRAHTTWLRAQRPFDLTVCWHEDWESAGAYAYEVFRPEVPPRTSVARDWLDALAAHGMPVERAADIEGSPAHNGLVSVPFSRDLMPDWPEAFFLLAEKTALAYTVETPSQWTLDQRCAMAARFIRRLQEGAEFPT